MQCELGKDATNVAPGLTTRSKKLLVTKGIATSSKKAARNKKLLGAPGLTTRSKDATRGSWHRY